MYSRKFVEKNTILLTVAGSRMYGTDNSFSDWDWRGICVRPFDSYLSFEGFEQKDGGWETEEGLPEEPFSRLSKDTVIYDIKKFLQLANGGNPNILELLFSNEYAHLTEVGKELLKVRCDFLTKACKPRYVGYAYGQLKRMESHRNWLLQPPEASPDPANYGFSDNYPLLSKDDVLAFCEFLFDSIKNKIEYLQPTELFHTLLFEKLDYKALFKTYLFEPEHITTVSKLTGVEENLVLKVQNSKRYYNDLKKWSNYQSWLKNRNPDRARMEAICGYDNKHALHSLRLLYQARGIFKSGFLQVSIESLEKDETNFLRDIKKGVVPYKKVKTQADQLFNQLNNADVSHLPKPMTLKQLSDLFIKLVKLHEKI